MMNQIPTQLRVGSRTLKTALGVTCILFLGLTPLITTPFYAALGTIQGMQPSVSASKKEVRDRITGCIIGATIGYAFFVLGINNPLLSGLAVILCIVICNTLQLSKSIYITLTICISVLTELSSYDPLTYAVLRIWDTSLGILVGLFVNRFVMRPNYVNKILEAFFQIGVLTEEALKETNVVNVNQIPAIKKEMAKLDKYFSHYDVDVALEKSSDKHIEISQKVSACHELYFHLKCLRMIKNENLIASVETNMTAFHLKKVDEYLKILKK